MPVVRRYAPDYARHFCHELIACSPFMLLICYPFECVLRFCCHFHIIYEPLRHFMRTVNINNSPNNKCDHNAFFIFWRCFERTLGILFLCPKYTIGLLFNATYARTCYLQCSHMLPPAYAFLCDRLEPMLLPTNYAKHKANLLGQGLRCAIETQSDFKGQVQRKALPEKKNEKQKA